MEIHSITPAYRYTAPASGGPGTDRTQGNSLITAPEPASATRPSDRTDSPTETDSADYQALRALQQRDREVRAHEQAHLSAAGRFAVSGANFDFQRGPDGRLYAVGGDVRIDASPVPGDPQATLEKAEALHRAALAPSEPSAQDRRVAAQASRMAAAARAEIQQAARENLATTGPADETGTTRLENRLASSGAVSLKSESIEELDLLI
ncbi:putative metalloprotease CJM1_0395 family protein [Sedimenticola thiotaurini]|uniref:putative metalloprotease CJM1_0395 family protein n=1 Tax=Sedimenticola thiotaurini TaxID=1543721 RepID=UPI00069C79B3|nr:putative metalloprotease CJM1_0395 family protein [Sedimenticola thiotaurini]